MTQDEMQLVGKATHFCLWCALVCPPAAYLLDLLRCDCVVWDCKNLDWNYEFLAKHLGDTLTLSSVKRSTNLLLLPASSPIRF